MSHAAVGKALQVPGLSTSEKLLLVAIAHHDGPGGSWPSSATLAEYTGTNTRQVRKTLRKLTDRGLVEVHYNRGGTAATRVDRRPNLYRLHLDHGGSCVTSRESHGGSSRVPTGGPPGSPRGVLQDHRTVLEPSKNTAVTSEHATTAAASESAGGVESDGTRVAEVVAFAVRLLEEQRQGDGLRHAGPVLLEQLRTRAGEHTGVIARRLRAGEAVSSIAAAVADAVATDAAVPRSNVYALAERRREDPCATCEGTGHVEARTEPGAPSAVEPCPDCGTTGVASGAMP